MVYFEEKEKGEVRAFYFGGGKRNVDFWEVLQTPAARPAIFDTSSHTSTGLMSQQATVRNVRLISFIFRVIT
jgi:hypothetical protein